MGNDRIMVGKPAQRLVIQRDNGFAGVQQLIEANAGSCVDKPLSAKRLPKTLTFRKEEKLRLETLKK